MAVVRLLVTSYLRLITVEVWKVSPITSASTRTSFSVPTTRRGSSMSTGFEAHPAANSTATPTTTHDRSCTGASSLPEDNASDGLQKSAGGAGAHRCQNVPTDWRSASGITE